MNSKEIICPFDPIIVHRVKYLCSCGLPQPLSKLYFCRHCLDLRCGFCVLHEVDSHYCPNCLENMPSAEARLKKNRCANCFDCPSCGHTLSTRASSMPIKAPTEDGTAIKTVTKKLYYLACAFCRWTSRDAGLPDQTVASGAWPQPEAPEAARFATLQDHYRTLAQREKLEKENRRFYGRKLSYMQLTDKYGLSATVARRRAGLPPLHSLTSKPTPQEGNTGQVPLAPAESKMMEEVEKFDVESMFNHDDPVDLSSIATLEQRLAQIDIQPESVLKLFPRHKYLMIKRSQRCRKCEHNLSKPEYNPTSIKFKIQLAAFYHIPEISIYMLGNFPMVPGSEYGFVLKMANPTQHATYVEFLDLEKYMGERRRQLAKEVEIEEVEKDTAKAESEQQLPQQQPTSMAASGGPPTSRMTSSYLRQPTLVKASEKHEIIPNAKLIIPKTAKIYLPPRDDAAEFDDSGPDLRGVVDDEKVVSWRKGNKACVMLSAMLDKNIQQGDDIVTGFALKFVYTNTIQAIENREVQTSDITAPVYVVLGKME